MKEEHKIREGEEGRNEVKEGKQSEDKRGDEQNNDMKGVQKET